jgi:hypothetical protein
VCYCAFFFFLPVEHDYDKEFEDEGMESNVDTKPERLQLITALDVIFWDEAMANHRECLEAVMNKFENLKGIIRNYIAYFYNLQQLTI